ncbi:type I restriction endonuclease [Nostoc sp.]
MPESLNFSFLAVHDQQLVRLGALAERYFADDPNTCLIKLRQFGELLAQLAAANIGLYEVADERQINLLNRLCDRGLIKGEVDRLFHELRKIGNQATHELSGNHRTALSGLKYARALGIWFHRAFGGGRNFDPGGFIPPPDPKIETETLKAELARLREEAQRHLVIAETEAQRRTSAEDLAREAQAKVQEVLQHLAEIQAQAQNQSQQTIQQTITQAQVAESGVLLDERETRRLIDIQLRAAGWEADSEELTYQNGVHPHKGRNLAIAEYPTANGRADYALFCGLQIVAVVEAKRQSKDVSEGALNQAKRYSEGFQVLGEEFLASRSWQNYKVPFVFATNGRPYLQQLQTKSGIWFCDLRRPTNLRVCLATWHSPQETSPKTIKALLWLAYRM